MTIVQDFGTWHTELHEVNVTIDDTAGNYDSSLIQLDRPGRYLYSNVLAYSIPANDNAEAIAAILGQFGPPSGLAAYFAGTYISQLGVRIKKQAGTAGSTVCVIKVMVALNDAFSSTT